MAAACTATATTIKAMGEAGAAFCPIADHRRRLSNRSRSDTVVMPQAHFSEVVMPKFIQAFLASVAIAFCLATFWSDASAQAITEFPLPVTEAIVYITAGPDGNLWFTEQEHNQIARITTSGFVTEFAIPTASSTPKGLTTGSDGNLWFVEENGNKIGRITIGSNIITEFPIPTAQSTPFGIAPGPDGDLWFTEVQQGNAIGSITTSGVFSQFPIPTAQSGPFAIVTGPDGARWFTETDTNKIGRVRIPFLGMPAIDEFPVPTAGSQPSGIVVGPDGNLWFAEEGAGKIGRITTAGAITEFPLPAGLLGPIFITAGPDGNMWFTAGQIGRITTSGVVTKFAIPADMTEPLGITTGPDGNLWFATPGKIGRLIPPPSSSPLFASVLPSSRSVQVNKFVTVFASILNNSDTAQTGCGIASVSSLPEVLFSFQTTDTATNTPTGTQNTRVAIPAHTVQSFLVSFLAAAPQVPTIFQLGYDCDGVDATATIVGVNTMLTTFDTNPVPDMIAVGLTPSNDGFAHTGGNSGTGLFALATDNIGASASLTARVRLSNPSLPISATICKTNSTTGACLTPAAATATSTVNTNDTGTWTAFLLATGAVNADPAHNRAFVEFVDAGGIVRGSTSTAVTTQ
jgi:streptogramin lyase